MGVYSKYSFPPFLTHTLQGFLCMGTKTACAVGASIFNTKSIFSSSFKSDLSNYNWDNWVTNKATTVVIINILSRKLIPTAKNQNSPVARQSYLAPYAFASDLVKKTVLVKWQYFKKNRKCEQVQKIMHTWTGQSESQISLQIRVLISNNFMAHSGIF
jgi:hypothetical protein